MKFIYPDNPLIRALTDRPETWEGFYDALITLFGRNFKCVESYYLFFEYIGFTKEKLEIPHLLSQPHFEGVASEKMLEKHLLSINEYIHKKLYSLKGDLHSLIHERMKHTSPFRASQELVHSLFGTIFLLMEKNFEEFITYSTTHLAWDVFCAIHPLRLPLKLIREKQLGLWLNRWEQGTKLPFGKLIDDQSPNYKMDFTSPFKEREDMVDAEMHTYLILGYEIEEQIHSVHCLTYPPQDPHALSKRTELALSTIVHLQNTLGKEIQKISGKIYSLDKKTHTLIETHEPM
ncbi:MAG: hypothetical protein JSR80_06545 [Verrucomicrobia bacterium]|nr:hypothetical protein [Verrucomicrobiota bacterium]